MKSTINNCFANVRKCMIWQERNCMNCKKAVWFNERLRRMPKYRCAVQAHIEQQQAEPETEIPLRSYDAAQQEHCPFFVSKEEKEAEIEVLDFSKGESIIQDVKIQQNEQEEPKTEYKKPEQAKEKPESGYITAETVKFAQKMGVPVEEIVDAEKRMWQTIKRNGKMPPIAEAVFRNDIHKATMENLESMTWDENMMIAFVPLVISEIAWMYAEDVLNYCARNKIQEVKKLTRAIKELRSNYIDTLKLDLDFDHIKNIEMKTKEFMEEYVSDFTILWYQCNQAIKTQLPGMAYEDMRTHAYCGIMIIDFLHEHNKRMDKLIEEKMGRCTPSIEQPQMKSLKVLLDAYFPDGFKAKKTENIELCKKILAAKVYNIEFKQKKEENGTE